MFSDVKAKYNNICELLHFNDLLFIQCLNIWLCLGIYEFFSKSFKIFNEAECHYPYIDIWMNFLACSFATIFGSFRSKRQGNL